jgi:hypothetical protein
MNIIYLHIILLLQYNTPLKTCFKTVIFLLKSGYINAENVISVSQSRILGGFDGSGEVHALPLLVLKTQSSSKNVVVVKTKMLECINLSDETKNDRKGLSMDYMFCCMFDLFHIIHTAIEQRKIDRSIDVSK